MAELIGHRGPDGQGVCMRSGHVRCSRRSSPTGCSGSFRVCRQPMHNSACVAASRATPLVLVFNGEIYNYRELRQRLPVRGHRLVSESDSEVILHLYEEPDLHASPRCAVCLRLQSGTFIRSESFVPETAWARSHFILAGIAADCRLPLKPGRYCRPTCPQERESICCEKLPEFGICLAPHSGFVGLQRRPGHTTVVDRSGVTETRYWHPTTRPSRKLARGQPSMV